MPSPEDEAALAEDVDLDMATRRHVLEVHGKLERLNHYELLGVDTAADKKTMRRAYFDLAAQFHPDRFFRRRLGSFKSRMEIIFGRITLAHDTLSDGDRRAEYDAYLDEQLRARGIERMLSEALAEAEREGESIEREVRAQQIPTSTPSVPPPSARSHEASRQAIPGQAPSQPPPRPRAASHPQIDVPPSPYRPRTGSSPQIDDLPPPRPRAASSPQIDAVPPPRPRVGSSPQIDAAARRDALARRLLGGRQSASSPPPRPSAAPPPVANVADAMDALRRRYEERVARAKAMQARRYAAEGEAALARGDTLAAANAFRVATALAPSDTSFEKPAHRAQAQADAVLGAAYAHQAAYEEKTGQWAEAIRSWTRVCAVRPNDANAHDRAANAILKAGGDLTEAARFGERACVIAPGKASYRATLAGIYLAAGDVARARRELESGAQLDPQDDTIQAMMRRVTP